MAMSDNMVRLAENPELRESMGRGARERFLDFDTPNQVRKLEELLISVCK